MAVLAVAQKTARTPDLQIPHGDAEAGAEGRELPDSGEPLLGDIGQGLVPPEGEVGIGLAAGAAHPASYLVQLGKAHAVSVLDDEGVAVAHVDAGLDEGGAHQNIDLAVQQMLPHGVQLFLGHLAVGNANACAGHQLAHMGGAGFDVVHPVVQVVHLPAPGKLLLHGFGKDHVVVFQHKGLHGLPLDGRLLDGGKVPDSAHGHVQRAGNGSGRKGEHVHPDEVLLELFLVLHTEALLFVDDDKAEVMELHVLGQQPVGAHHDVHTARLQAPEGLLLLFCGAEAGHHLHLYGKSFHAGKNGVVVLPRQQGGGGKDGALLAAHHALEGGAQGHFGFAHAHVAAQQAVHGPALFHVLLDLGGGVQLVVGLVVVKAGLKVPLPVAVRREGVARGLTAAGVKLDQLLRHLLGGLFHLGAGALPLGAAQLCQLYLFLVAGGGVAAQQVQLGHRNIQHIRAGILYLEVIFRGTLHFQPLDARIHANAVALVHHVIPGLDVRKAGKGVLVLFALFGLGGGLFLQTVPAAGQHCRMGKGKGAPGGQMARQHLYDAFCGPHIPAHAHGVALVGKVAGEGGGTLGRSGKQGDGIALRNERVKVFSQGDKVAVPVGGGKGLGVDEVFQLKFVHAAQEVLAQQGALLLGGSGKVVHGLVEYIQPGAEHTLFQQAGQLFAATELGGLLGIPDAAHLVQNEQRCVQMIQQGGRFWVTQAVIFIHGFRHQAGVQLGKVGFRGLFQCGAVPAACLFDGGTQGLGSLGGIAEQHLAGRGKIDLFQCAVPPLGEQIEGGNGIDLVVPVLHAGRLAHIRRIDIHDIAAHTELSRAVHLTAPHIPGGEQPGHKPLTVVHHAGFEGKSVL